MLRWQTCFATESVEIASKPRPGRQRSASPTPTNLKPYLLVDEARYALGVPEIGKEEEGELLHSGFVSLLEDVCDATKAPYLSPILTYLNEFIDRAELAKIIEPRDVVTFTLGSCHIHSSDGKCVNSGSSYQF